MPTRIIGGRHRGRRLRIPAAGTRPTSDRAREALFNTLESAIGLDGARVLDLFAGSGAVGLEALSRGAAQAVLVESDPIAAKVIAANIASLPTTSARLLRTTVAAFLDTAPQPFDVVFADPPYAMADDEVDTIVATVTGRGWLADAGMVVVERSVRGPGPRWPDEIDTMPVRRYGEAALWYGRRRPAGSD